MVWARGQLTVWKEQQGSHQSREEGKMSFLPLFCNFVNIYDFERCSKVPTIQRHDGRTLPSIAYVRGKLFTVKTLHVLACSILKISRK